MGACCPGIYPREPRTENREPSANREPGELDRELRESGPVKEKKVLSLKKTPGFASYPL